MSRLTRWRVESLLPSRSFGGGIRDTRYGYDDLGNLTSVTANGAIEFDGSYGEGGRPHALAADGALGEFDYDALGRQTNGGGRSLVTYTGLSLPRTIETDPGTTQFQYDSFGRRSRKSGPSGTTLYIGGIYERRKTAASTHHVFYVEGPEGTVAQLVHEEGSAEEALAYFTNDSLGSVSLITDDEGGLVERRFQEPFGNTVDESGTPATPIASGVTIGFTGHPEDTELDLIDMGGRVYDPRQRRFLTADAIIPDPFSVQGLNPYSYVLNRPLHFTDPTGFEPAPVAMDDPAIAAPPADPGPVDAPAYVPTETPGDYCDVAGNCGAIPVTEIVVGGGDGTGGDKNAGDALPTMGSSALVYGPTIGGDGGDGPGGGDSEVFDTMARGIAQDFDEVMDGVVPFLGSNPDMTTYYPNTAVGPGLDVSTLAPIVRLTNTVRFPDVEDTFLVFTHGNAHEVTVPMEFDQIDNERDEGTSNAGEIAAWIRSHRDYRPGMKVRLFSCETARDANGIAARLARELRPTVVAPTGITNGFGTTFDRAPGSDLTFWDRLDLAGDSFNPVIKMTGRWVEFPAP